MADDIESIVASRLHMVLEDLDEKHEGILTEREARLYFAVERYLYPENEIFRPENIAATEQAYLKRTTDRLDIPEHGTIGPLCEYFYNYNIASCEHVSCLRICDETDPVYPIEFEGR
jgi:hypothetical protein